MNRRTEFWERVNAALDERRDLLSDLVVQRLVAEEPALLDHLGAFERGLESARSSPHVRSRGRRVAALAGVLVVLALVLGVLIARSRMDVPAESIVVRPVEKSTVLACRVTIVRMGRHGTESWEDDGSQRTRAFVARDGTRIETATSAGSLLNRGSK